MTVLQYTAASVLGRISMPILGRFLMFSIRFLGFGADFGQISLIFDSDLLAKLQQEQSGRGGIIDSETGKLEEI